MQACFISVFFGNLPDPRSSRNQRHPLINIVAIAVFAVICGAQDWDDVVAFGKMRKQWLRKYLRLGRGIPSKRTFERALAALDPDALNACFVKWTTSVFGNTEEKHIAIDGKRLRGSYQRKGKKGALHVVSVWATEDRVVFGQSAIRTKSNEITAIPKVLELVQLRGATITIDAMGCQKTIVQQIVAGSGHYVVAVKKNQPRLYAAIEAAFVTVEIGDEPIQHRSTFATIERGHGRQEIRRVTALDSERLLSCREQWAGLKSIVKLESERTCKGKTTQETRYYISSHVADAQLQAKLIPDHWGIENQQHWRLDVIFHEDRNRIRKGNSAMNFAIVRRIALNTLLSAERDAAASGHTDLNWR